MEVTEPIGEKISFSLASLRTFFPRDTPLRAGQQPYCPARTKPLWSLSQLSIIAPAPWLLYCFIFWPKFQEFGRVLSSNSRRRQERIIVIWEIIIYSAFC
ncbi:hypothetical protein MOUN0_K09582 [Monosporozyma unispora]